MQYQITLNLMDYAINLKKKKIIGKCLADLKI